MKPIVRTTADMLLVLVTGLSIGLAANALSPDGLDLQRDYFPKAAAPPTAAVEQVEQVEVPEEDQTGSAPAEDPQTSALDPAVLERLGSKGLRGVSFDEAVALYEDPMYAYEAHVFIDARDDDHYADGHIPGAHQFDHFRADRFQDQMMQIIPTAMEIVVYCNGGDCEDSESAALFLLGLGADPAHVTVYTGGIEEWRARKMPVERGVRNSGDLVEQTP